MKRLGRLIAFSTLVWNAGCEQFECGDVDPVLRVGMGKKSFTPIQDGDLLYSERGSQGGQHVWVALETEGVNLDEPNLSLSLRYGDEVIGEGDGDWARWKGDMGAGHTYGLQLFLQPYQDEEVQVDGPVQLVVLLSDNCGTSLLVERSVNLR